MDLKRVKVNAMLLVQPKIDIMHLKLDTDRMALTDLKLIFLKLYENLSIPQDMQTGTSELVMVEEL